VRLDVSATLGRTTPVLAAPSPAPPQLRLNMRQSFFLDTGGKSLMTPAVPGGDECE